MRNLANSDKVLILPGDPEFNLTLSTALPPGWKDVANGMGMQCAFIAKTGSGILQPVSSRELDDYLYGGEYEERLTEIGWDDDLD